MLMIILKYMAVKQNTWMCACRQRESDIVAPWWGTWASPHRSPWHFHTFQVAHLWHSYPALYVNTVRMVWCYHLSQRNQPQIQNWSCLKPSRAGRGRVRTFRIYGDESWQILSHIVSKLGEKIYTPQKNRREIRLKCKCILGTFKLFNTHSVFIRNTSKRYRWKSFGWQTIWGQ